MRSERWKSLIGWGVVCCIAVVGLAGCATVTKESDQPAFMHDARSATSWFESKVPGLHAQIENSAGYIIYPSVKQWGMLFGGGRFGRGLVARPDGSQIGWGAINTGSLGLQAGVQGFKMLVVFKDQATLDKFIGNRLTGGVSGVIVVADDGTSGTATFYQGVAIYQGANVGLMAGVNVGLDFMRYQEMD